MKNKDREGIGGRRDLRRQREKEERAVKKVKDACVCKKAKNSLKASTRVSLSGNTLDDVSLGYI